MYIFNDLIHFIFILYLFLGLLIMQLTDEEQNAWIFIVSYVFYFILAFICWYFLWRSRRHIFNVSANVWCRSPSSPSSQLPRRLTSPLWITLMAFCTSAGHTASSSLTCRTQGCCTGKWSLSGRRDRRRRTPLTWVQTHLSRCSRHSETRSRCFRCICAFVWWWVCLQQQLIISGLSGAVIDSLLRVGLMVWLAAGEWPADVAALRVQLPP